MDNIFLKEWVFLEEKINPNNEIDFPYFFYLFLK